MYDIHVLLCKHCTFCKSPVGFWWYISKLFCDFSDRDMVLFAKLNWQVSPHYDTEATFKILSFLKNCRTVAPGFFCYAKRHATTTAYFSFNVPPMSFRAIVLIFKYKDISVLNYNLYANESLFCTFMSPTYNIFLSIAIQIYTL